MKLLFLSEDRSQLLLAHAFLLCFLSLQGGAPAVRGQGVVAVQLPVGVPAPAPAQSPTRMGPLSESEESCPCPETPDFTADNGGPETCSISKVKVRQDHEAPSAGSKLLMLSDFTRIFGAGPLTEVQRSEMKLAPVSRTSFSCLDDRITTSALATPGGDLGEFIAGLAAYLDTRGGSGGSAAAAPVLTQQMVDVFLRRYVTTVVPEGRPMRHCTDDRALRHLESAMQVENLDLNSPPDRIKDAGLLARLTEVENHGDSHIRLLLKDPAAYGMPNPMLVPMALKAFYGLLWEQHQNPDSPLHGTPRLELVVLSGESNPSAFVEVSVGEVCQQDGLAPLVTPRAEGRSLLVSHLDAVSLRREELAAFFSRLANATPHKIDKETLRKRLDRHGWMALETTGRRIASGLPFYSLAYV